MTDSKHPQDDTQRTSNDEQFPLPEKWADFLLKALPVVLGTGAGAGISLLNTTDLPRIALGAGIGGAGTLGYSLVAPTFKKAKKQADKAGEATANRADNLFSRVTGVEEKYLQCQALDCQAYRSEGVGNFDGIFTPLLEEVFVPLELDYSGMRAGFSPEDCALIEQRDEGLQIWDLLESGKAQIAFRQMVILAWGGYGKTTLLKHIAYSYGTKRKAVYEGKRRIPVLLVLRKYRQLLVQEKPPSLPELIMQYHVPSFPGAGDLSLPEQWARDILRQGKAVVLLDGFDEVPKEQRSAVVRWVNQQMRDYSKAAFLITSRPKAYQEQDPAEKLEIGAQIWIRDFEVKQRERFVRQWYSCQERYANGGRETPDVEKHAQEMADELLGQIEARRELQDLAKNPLLLNMIVTFHRRYPGADLPERRTELYGEICRLQLRDRPNARKLESSLKQCESQIILQMLALDMMLAKQERIEKAALLTNLERYLAEQNEPVAAADFLKDVVEISELLVEREPGEYDFAHLSFQEYLAAVEIKRLDQESLLYDHFEDGWWKPTILLYLGQMKQPGDLLKKMLDAGATNFAYACLKETMKKVDLSTQQQVTLLSGHTWRVTLSEEQKQNVKRLIASIKSSRYDKLEELLKTGEWEAADEETYRLMITAVGKEEGRGFSRKDLEEFPCDELLEIDRLWVAASKGHFGFSVQKKIWEECGSPMQLSKEHEEFTNRVGWRKNFDWLSYSALQKDPLRSPKGEMPCWDWGSYGFSAIAQRLTNCSRQ